MEGTVGRFATTCLHTNGKLYTDTSRPAALLEYGLETGEAKQCGILTKNYFHGGGKIIEMKDGRLCIACGINVMTGRILYTRRFPGKPLSGNREFDFKSTDRRVVLAGHRLIGVALRRRVVPPRGVASRTAADDVPIDDALLGVAIPGVESP